MGSNGKKEGAPDINDLLRSAQAEGTLSAGSLETLTVVDLGAQIQAGLGIAADDVQASEVVLVTLMPDDSGSIRFAGNAAAVREGHNLVLAALGASRQREAILAHTRYLNGTVLFPYLPVDQAVAMDSRNYDPSLGTPLYDQTVVVLGTVLAKAQQLADAGVLARTVTLLITDGADECSTRAGAADVARLVRDMGRSELHTVAAMGIDDGRTDFRKVFRDMGIEDRWILTPQSDPRAIRRAFQVFSQSALGLGQLSGAGPSMGGFVN